MSAVNFNMRLDAELKDKVTPILEDYGLTMPQAFKLFLNQIAKRKLSHYLSIMQRSQF